MKTRFFRPIRAVAAGLTLLSGGLACAQQLVISTAAAGNVYDLMTRQMAQVCQGGGLARTIASRTSSGSMESVDRLLNNEVPAAMVQTDVLRYRENKDDLSHIKALFQLHPEEVHVLTLSETSRLAVLVAGVPGIKHLGGAPASRLSDLRGRKVAAWGGSYITAQIIRLQTEIDFRVVEFPDEAAALKALTGKEVDAVLSVGGSPQPWVQRLDRRFRLVPIADAEAEKLKGVYRRAKLSYGNLGQAGVSTVATDAVLVVRDYKTPGMSGLLLWAQACLVEHLPELQETPGTQATWQKVVPTAAPSWPRYVAPSSKAPAVVKSNATRRVDVPR